MNLKDVQRITLELREQIHRVVIGQEHSVTLLLTALLASGHVLLEGVPGTAKTLLAKTFSQLLELKFGRIQFTPDLMPGDLIGTNLFNFQTNEFMLTPGPIFTELLLADELNRTPPKTQAALLQAMQERSVTIDGTLHDLGPGFMVIATQNPLEQEGTYPLPEAQLDRFLFKINIDYPTREQEIELVHLHGHCSGMPSLDEFGLKPVADIHALIEMRACIAELRLSSPMIDYIVDLVRATREHPALLAGASPRASNMLASASRAFAALSGRDYVIPDDIKHIAEPVLAHRLILSPGAEIEGISSSTILSQILSRIPAPR